MDHNRYIAQNLRAFYREIALHCGYSCSQFSGMEVVRNRDGSWPAYIIGVPALHEIPGLADEMHGGRLPSVLILDRDAADEVRLLEKQGLRTIRAWKGMDLGPGDFRPADLPKGLELVRNEPASLAGWLQMVNRDAMSGHQLGPEIAFALGSCDKFDWILARKEGIDAGAGLLFTERGSAGLYFIVSRPELRGQGIGSAIVSSLVEQAFDRGNERVVLHSTGMGEGLYRRAGFRQRSEYLLLWSPGKG